MRRVFWQMNVTLDGFMEGPNRELDYTAHVVDEDFDRYATKNRSTRFSWDGLLINSLPAIGHLRRVRMLTG